MVRKSLFSFIQKKLFLFILTPLILLGVTFFTLQQVHTRILDSFNVILHTKQVSTELDHLLKLHLDAETGLRGFSLTEEEIFLEPYEGSFKKIHENFVRLNELTRDNPTQQENIETLKSFSLEWFEGLEPENLVKVPLRSRLKLFLAKKKRMDTIRAQVAKMSDHEAFLLKQRHKDLFEEFNSSKFLIFIFIFFCITASLYLAVAIFRQAFAYQEDVAKNLEASNRELKLALESRDNFMSLASHELQTPLTSLKIKAQHQRRLVLNKHPLAYANEKMDDLVDTVLRQGDRLSHLVNDMMDVTRITSGNLQINRENFELSIFIKDVLQKLQSQFDQAEQMISMGKVPDGLQVYWDRSRIEQVLTNLLMNALRYGKKAEVNISVEVHGEEISLKVKDHGIGIEKDFLEKIFHRFERAISSNEVSGMGLGLYISKEIVEAHGGHITVESQIDKGSEFTIKLPRMVL